MANHFRKKRFARPSLVCGFTLVEIIIAISVLLLILAISVFAFANLGNSTALETSLSQVVSDLNDARSQTLASRSDTQYGVHLESDKIVFFTGASYDPSDSANISTNINNKVEIADISLNGGGSDIVFERLTGETDQYGTFVVRLKDGTTSKTVNVFKTGIIEVS